MKSLKSEVLKNAFFIVLKDKKEYEIKHDIGLYDYCPFCKDNRAQAYLFRNDRSSKYTVTYKDFLCRSIEMDTQKIDDIQAHLFFNKKQRNNTIFNLLKRQMLGA